MNSKEQIMIEKDIYTLTKADLVEQLISKTQECEKWKNQVLILDDENVTIQVTQEQFEEYQQLKQECEKLEKKLRELELENTTLQNRNQQLDGSMTEVNRYRKALEEIEREITALHYITIPFHRGITHELADIVQEYKNKILDIINKAKGEGNE